MAVGKVPSRKGIQRQPSGQDEIWHTDSNGPWPQTPGVQGPGPTNIPGAASTGFDPTRNITYVNSTGYLNPYGEYVAPDPYHGGGFNDQGQYSPGIWGGPGS